MGASLCGFKGGLCQAASDPLLELGRTVTNDPAHPYSRDPVTAWRGVIPKRLATDAQKPCRLVYADEELWRRGRLAHGRGALPRLKAFSEEVGGLGGDSSPYQMGKPIKRLQRLHSRTVDRLL